MLQSDSKKSTEFVGLPTARDTAPKPRLPSKRRRDTICGLGNFTKPFTIKPCPESPHDQPYTLRPVRVIGRSQLPLSFLDTSSHGDLASNRLFSASIDILDRQNESHEKENAAPKVLIARLENRRTLYAVERIQARVYSLCKLASWLKEKEVAELWDPEGLNSYPTFPKMAQTDVSGGEWWKHATVETTVAERPVKRVRLSMLRPQQPLEPVGLNAGLNAPHAPKEDSREKEHPSALVNDVAPGILEMPVEPTPQEQLETLVDQYLTAIYMSKTSLAYFAKGPITRIRNTFTSSREGAPPTHELVTFLRTMLLSHKAEEKKYREKLQEVIKAIPPGSFSDDDAEIHTKPKKSKKKIKLSREGMYPGEEETVKKWWNGELPNAEVFGEETIDQRIKRRLADLRVREALAQMILILEIIALEALSTYKRPQEDNSTEEFQVKAESQLKSQKRKKKLENVSLLLDLLLDKLCIWQSVEQDGVLDFDRKHAQQDEGASSSNDRLQSFCVEVVVPFYMNRLPEQARMVNKKLGGPANTSPPKRKAMKPPTISRKSGEPKEPDAKKTRRTLGRVATDTTVNTAQGRPPPLTRSTTDSVLLNGIKREGSEVPLSAIPFQRSPSAAARQSMSHLKHLKGREIDLTTTSAAAAAKMKQKKRVEEDLREAITALKKPNRGLAAGSYADEIEQRAVSTSNRSRKPANPVRKVIKEVQVSATPRVARRAKHVIEQTPTHHRNPFIRPRETDLPPSSDFFIPSSAARPPSSIVPATIQRSATARTLAASGVAETPSRPPMTKVFLKSSDVRDSIFTTPSKSRTAFPDSPPQGMDATPTKGINSSPPNNMAATPSILFATPSKKATPQIAESPLPNSSKPAMEGEGPSIYDALGWNDDDDFV